MSNGTVNIRNKVYKTVALRVNEFREGHSVDAGWAITTELLTFTPDTVCVKAFINDPEGRVVATGHAQETWEGNINSTSAVENCETSAIGRALAAAGLGGEEFASANEVERAVEQQENGQSNRPKTNGKPAAKPATNGAATIDPVAGADKLFAKCATKEDFLKGIDRVAKGKDKFADHDQFETGLATLLPHARKAKLTDDEMLHINRKIAYYLTPITGTMTEAELDMETDAAFAG